MLICQITDLHIRLPGQLCYGVVDTAKALSACLASIHAIPQAPDVIVITGDLVDFGRDTEYQHLKSLLESVAIPVYVIPGNHDDRDALRHAFPSHSYLGAQGSPVNYVVDDFAVRIIGIDTTIPGASGGIVSEETLDWLDRQLSRAPQQPTLLMMHHPPFETGIGHMDDIGLEGASSLAKVVAHHAQIERIICGHLHRSIATRFAGTIASTCPSPAHQVVLDLDQNAAPLFAMEPPGYQLHLFIPGQGLVTHTAAIGRFPGPHPFFDDAGLID
jgi:3',5'-cyclic-AMP phosphodiesterase